MNRTLVVMFVAAPLADVPAVSQPLPSMTAHFIDVGQGDATLLEFPCGAMLVDADAQDDADQE